MQEKKGGGKRKKGRRGTDTAHGCPCSISVIPLLSHCPMKGSSPPAATCVDVLSWRQRGKKGEERGGRKIGRSERSGVVARLER